MSDRTLVRQAAGLTFIVLLARYLRALGGAGFNLCGKVALITGGSRGLGLLLARELGRRGARVAICARNQSELNRAQQELENRGIETFARQCDVSSFAEVDSFVEATLERFGELDIVINNAGNIFVGPVDAMSWNEYRGAMDVIFGGTARVTLATLPYLHPGARIVNISSIGGWIPVPHLLPYSAAKHAVTGFSLGLREELLERGIRVVTVLPGLMRTGSFLNALFKGDRESEVAWFALGASLPGASISGERAARQIVEACRRGTPLVTLGLTAKLARIFHGLFPGATVRLLTLVNRALPKAPSISAADEPPESGWRYRSRLSRPPFTWLGDRAARKNNERAA